MKYKILVECENCGEGHPFVPDLRPQLNTLLGYLANDDVPSAISMVHNLIEAY